MTLDIQCNCLPSEAVSTSAFTSSSRHSALATASASWFNHSGQGVRSNGDERHLSQLPVSVRAGYWALGGYICQLHSIVRTVWTCGAWFDLLKLHVELRKQGELRGELFFVRHPSGEQVGTSQHCRLAIVEGEAFGRLLLIYHQPVVQQVTVRLTSPGRDHSARFLAPGLSSPSAADPATE